MNSMLSLHLSNFCVSKLSNNEPSFVNFVVDHYAKLRDEATVISIDLKDMETYRFRLEDYLLDKGYDRNVAWVVLLLNQLNSNRDFVNLKTLRMPNTTTLSSLRAQYETYRALKHKVESK